MKKCNGEGTLYYSEKLKKYVGQISLGRNSEGKVIRKSIYGDTRTKVKEKMIQMQAEYNVGQYADDKGITLSRWIDKWFNLYKVHDFKTATYEKEYRRSARIRNGFIGKMKLDEIKPYNVQTFINEIGDELSPKTIRNIYILLNGAMKQAKAEGLIHNNPCDNVVLPKEEVSEMVALDNNEKKIFLEEAKDSPYYDLFVFALNTGLRISEICGLVRENINFEKGYINITQQLVRIKGALFLDSPKTSRSVRQVPMNEVARSILMKYMFNEYSHIKYVFYNPVNHNQLVQNTLSINCHRIFKKCYDRTHNPKFLKANFHSLRHTFATQWLLQGGNVVLLSKVLGHTDTAFTMRVYVQPSNDDIRNEMLAMSF